MNAKSGKAVKAVKPTEASEVFEADDASPGKVAKAKAEQIKQKKGKYGQTKAPPFKPAEAEETHWIEIELIDEADEPVPGERYEITLPDGSFSGGTLDANGKARIEGIAESGDCRITFPNLDKDAWEPA